MHISVLYFASLREQLARSREALDLPAEVQTVEALRRWMLTRGEPFASALALGKSVRVAVNQQITQGDQAIASGDEVAFFPPVTGG
jgi:sulfur-carrier protein